MESFLKYYFGNKKVQENSCFYVFFKREGDREYTCEYTMLEIFLRRIVKKMVKIAVFGEGNWVTREPRLGGNGTTLTI